MQHFIDIDIIFRLAISFSISGSLMFPRDPAAWSGGEIMYKTPVLSMLQYYVLMYYTSVPYAIIYCTVHLYCTLILYLFFPGQDPLPSLPQLTHRHMSLAEASSSASLMSSSLSLMASSSSLMTQSSSLMSPSSGGGVLNNLQSSPLWKNIETNFANECYSGEAEGKSKI